MKTLDRFIEIQNIQYHFALNEIKSGRKINHSMWYIFPQIDGLVQNPSYYSSKYAIQNKEEAITYLKHPILGVRLKEICQALLELNSKNIESVLGFTDSMKLKSCMTLFDAVNEESITIFKDILDKYYGGSKDEKTLSLLNMD